MQVAEYKRVDLIITIIHSMIGVLALAYLAFAARTTCMEGVWAGIKTLDQLAFLVSASLVTFVAHRQIIYTNIMLEEQRRQDKVRVFHHLLMIVQDLINRIHYTKNKISAEKMIPTSVLRSNAEAIGARFEIFYDRENFQHFSAEATQIIDDLSGSIFGLTSLMNEMASILEVSQDPKHTHSQILPLVTNLKESGAFDSVKSTLIRLDEELRRIRSTVE